MGIEDALAAYFFDAAVVTVSTIIENALHERVDVGVGDKKKSEPKYTLAQLLEDDFLLPRPERESKRKKAGLMQQLQQVFGGGLKVWKEAEGPQ